jgi:hypothetical protein
MGWRRGELWFDMEFLWFRERATDDGALFALHAPSFLPFAAPDAPDLVVRDGLAASRRRRAERRRRRHARRTRAAAALVVAPAAVLTLSGQRLGTGSAGGALQEDPPSMTSQRQLAKPPKPKPTRAKATPAEPKTPQIRWRNATSYGLPYAGSLSDGTQLPIESEHWVTWNPVTDSVPNDPHRLYGNERTIRRIVNVIEAYRAANPDAPRVLVGDISFRGGGPMELHHSHQNGLDVDVYYPRLDRSLRAPRTTDQVDRELAQRLLDGFLAAGARVVFVGYATGLRGPGGVVVPYPNHEDHLHVRFGSTG